MKAWVVVAGKAMAEPGVGDGKNLDEKGGAAAPPERNRTGTAYCWMQLSTLSAVHSSRPV